MARSSRADEEAFAEFYDLTASRIYGIVLRVVGSADQAAQVTHGVYVEVWRHCVRYARDGGSVLGRLARIAHRSAVDLLRSHTNEDVRDARNPVTGAYPVVDHEWERVEQNLDVERVRNAMASLTTIQREALNLAYFGGHTQSQMASVLKLPTETVKRRIRDALTGLRDALGGRSPIGTV